LRGTTLNWGAWIRYNHGVRFLLLDNPGKTNAA